jgi:hypothetical protein
VTLISVSSEIVQLLAKLTLFSWKRLTFNDPGFFWFPKLASMALGLMARLDQRARCWIRFSHSLHFKFDYIFLKFTHFTLLFTYTLLNFTLNSFEIGANLLAHPLYSMIFLKSKVTQHFSLLNFWKFRFHSHFRQNPLSTLLCLLC